MIKWIIEFSLPGFLKRLRKSILSYENLTVIFQNSFCDLWSNKFSYLYLLILSLPINNFVLISALQAKYTLPDGKTIELGSCRSRAPEVLFRPDIIGAEYPGIPACISSAIEVCLMGKGCSLFTIFGFRLVTPISGRISTPILSSAEAAQCSTASETVCSLR